MKKRYAHASLLFSLVLVTACFFCLSPNVISAASIVVQMDDLAASPLVNVVMVEGSTSAGAIAEAEASTSVPIRRSTTIAAVILKGEVVEE